MPCQCYCQRGAQLFYKAFYIPGGVAGLPWTQDHGGNLHPRWSTCTGNDNGCLAWTHHQMDGREQLGNTMCHVHILRKREEHFTNKKSVQGIVHQVFGTHWYCFCYCPCQCLFSYVSILHVSTLCRCMFSHVVTEFGVELLLFVGWIITCRVPHWVSGGVRNLERRLAQAWLRRKKIKKHPAPITNVGGGTSASQEIVIVYVYQLSHLGKFQGFQIWR